MAAFREREPLSHVESPSDDEEHDGRGEGGCSSNEEESDCDWGAWDDSEEDPTFDVAEETRSAFSKISLKKSKHRKKSEGDQEDEPDVVVVDEIPELDANDRKCFEIAEMLIKDGQLEKLKVDQCKVYLRKNGLRVTGKKDTLIDRIREHLEIKDGGGENKYPISSFVVDCKGDACTGDVVMFEQNVYEMFSIASRSATGPPLGKRLVAGRIVKESYGEAKQQHTFTIEVLWSKGEKALSPLHQLLIKGRNLYRLKTMRQRWDDEEERRRVLREKHARGFLARHYRENRIQEKEIRIKGRLNRTKEKNSSKVVNGRGIHNQGNPCLPAVLQPHWIQHQLPPQHHPKTQNSVELQVTEQAPGTRVQMKSNKPTTEYRENSVQQSKLQPRQPPQLSSSSVNSKVLQQVTNIIDIRSESRSKQPPLIENHYKYPRGCEQYFSRTDQLLQYDHAEHHHHQYQSQQRVNPYDRQSFVSVNHPLHPPNRQPCRYYRKGRCYFGNQCRYLHEY